MRIFFRVIAILSIPFLLVNLVITHTIRYGIENNEFINYNWEFIYNTTLFSFIINIFLITIVVFLVTSKSLWYSKKEIDKKKQELDKTIYKFYQKRVEIEEMFMLKMKKIDDIIDKLIND